MKKVITILVIAVIGGWAAQAMACGISGKSAGTESSGKNLASEYSLSGK